MPDPGLRPDFRSHFLEGVAHFNTTEFWEAHESWEELWRVASSDLREFLQGLIQIAAAYHHVKRGTLRGAVRLFESGLRRVAPFPERHCGLDRTPVVAAAMEHQQWAANMLSDSTSAEAPMAFPQFPVSSETGLPPRPDW